METLNYKNETVTLTEMESAVYTSIKNVSEMEDCYATHPEEVMYNTGIAMNKLRGVISSLDKKGVAYVDELISGCGRWVILYETPEA